MKDETKVDIFIAVIIILFIGAYIYGGWQFSELVKVSELSKEGQL